MSEPKKKRKNPISLRENKLLSGMKSLCLRPFGSLSPGYCCLRSCQPGWHSWCSWLLSWSWNCGLGVCQPLTLLFPVSYKKLPKQLKVQSFQQKYSKDGGRGWQTTLILLRNVLYHVDLKRKRTLPTAHPINYGVLVVSFVCFHYSLSCAWGRNLHQKFTEQWMNEWLNYACFWFRTNGQIVLRKWLNRGFFFPLIKCNF